MKQVCQVERNPAMAPSVTQPHLCLELQAQLIQHLYHRPSDGDSEDRMGARRAAGD